MAKSFSVPHFQFINTTPFPPPPQLQPANWPGETILEHSTRHGFEWVISRGERFDTSGKLDADTSDLFARLRLPDGHPWRSLRDYYSPRGAFYQVIDDGGAVAKGLRPPLNSPRWIMYPCGLETLLIEGGRMTEEQAIASIRRQVEQLCDEAAAAGAMI